MRLIERSEEKASLYALFASGAHVGILIKQDGGSDRLAVAIKCDSEAVAAALVQELEAHRDKLQHEQQEQQKQTQQTAQQKQPTPPSSPAAAAQ